jgi:hypothetical protein
MVTRRQLLKYCAACAGLIALPSSSTLAQSATSTLDPAKMVCQTKSRVVSFEVISIDPTSSRLNGKSSEGQPVGVQLNSDTTIHGKYVRTFSTRIKPGDLVIARTRVQPSGDLVATDLAINTWEGIVRITGLTSNGITFVPVDYHTLKPRGHLTWSEGSLPPHFGTLLRPAEIYVVSGRSAALDRSLIGRAAKVFGFKPPISATVKVTRVELIPEPTYK